MLHKFAIKTIAFTAALGFAAVASAGTTLAGWQFTATVPANDNTPAATSGVDASTAVLTQLGMTNSYNGGNTADADVTATTGDPNTGATGFAWRVRGAPDNGWALAAPQYTQGAELDVSTVGYSNISFSFDWYCTTQGIEDLMVQYNTNINNAGGWTNYSGSVAGVATQSTSNGTLLLADSNAYNTQATTATATTNVINLAGIAGVSNDANFGIRLVSAYDPTAGTYLGAAGGTYNNTSGNWRFDQLFVTGTAAPELPTGIVFAVAGLALVVLKARRA